MAGLTRELIGMRIAKELSEGMYINLGIGLPTVVSNFIPEELEVSRRYCSLEPVLFTALTPSV